MQELAGKTVAMIRPAYSSHKKRKLLLNLKYKEHQIPKLKCFLFRLAVVSVQSIEARR